MVMSNYYSKNLEGYTRVKFPVYNPRVVREFLRTTFGENDIHEMFTQRRWITAGPDEYIYFRDAQDAAWFKLAWRH